MKNTKTLTRVALLVAIELVMKMVGLGSVPVGPLYMSFLTLPIAVGAITMGPAVGALLGGVFGAVSFYDAITGASAMTGALFQVSPVNTFILCVGMRVLMGLCCGLIFSMDDTYIWGRGAIDMKDQVAGILEAVEYALSHGWEHERTLLLAFGQDEETTQFGAGAIGHVLEERGVELEFLIDEGDYRIVPAAEYSAGEGWLMHADLAEKGYADIVLRTRSEGGHSSNPYGGTSLEVLSRAIAAICDIEWPTRVMDLLAAQLVELGLYTADEIASNKDAIVRECLASKKLYPLVTTTCAPTQIEGGSTGANVMPQDMWANINFRMLEGTSVADVVARCRVAVAEAGLADRVEIELGPGSSEPSPSSRIGGPGLETVRAIAARYFRDPKGTEENGSSEPLAIVPSTVIGATDAANYQRICHECIRFSAFVVDDDECDRGVHGTNERITRRAYLQGIRFLVALLQTL